MEVKPEGTARRLAPVSAAGGVMITGLNVSITYVGVMFLVRMSLLLLFSSFFNFVSVTAASPLM